MTKVAENAAIEVMENHIDALNYLDEEKTDKNVTFSTLPTGWHKINLLAYIREIPCRLS